jgi:hypothetical protein
VKSNKKFQLELQKDKAKFEQCPVVYAGKSYPQFHGRRCTIKGHPHPGTRHENCGLYWWSEEEKELIRKQREE